MVFSRKEDLLSLYNAINGTSYSNPDDLEVATLENALYLSMKNDLAFLLDVVLNLYEHQSTFNCAESLRTSEHIQSEHAHAGAAVLCQTV